MNHLVIIGNGLDLAYGLKTSYMDFILWYLNKAIGTFNKAGNYKDDLIAIKAQDDPINTLYRENISIQQINDLTDFKSRLDQYPTIIKSENFLNTLIQKAIDLNWIDIETHYFGLLKAAYRFYKNGDIPTGNQLLTTINKSLSTMTKELEKYLTEIDAKDKHITQEKFNRLFQRFNPHENKNNYNEVYFLNFNYTSTIEPYIKNLNWTPTTNYIHGQLNNPENPIIFGYGDETDEHYEEMEKLNINEFLTHFKSFGYFNTPNYQQLLSYIDGNAFTVSIIGHSCGLSDRVLFKSIFEHPHCHSIEIHFRERSDGSNNYTQLTHEISRHFSDKSKMRKIVKNIKGCRSLNQLLK